MVMRGYTGNFLASNAANYPALPDNTRNWGEGVDPRHDTESFNPDAGFPPPEHHPKLRVPSYIEDDMVYIGTEPPYFPDAETEAAQYDDINQHSVPTLPRGVPDNDKLRQQSARLHGEQRRIFPYQMTTKVDRDVTEVNETARLQSLPQSPQGGPLTGYALRALRGRNSLAVNNPGDPDVSFSGNYVRQGWEISRWTNRRMARRGINHTKRPLMPNLATTATNRPGASGPYVSPYPTFARLNVGTYRPSVRREPQQWDLDVAEDYAEDEDSERFLTWGL